jgi:hypothetical protein
MAVAGICDLPGSPKISYTQNGGITATRTVKCPWVDWRDYADELAPATEVIGTVVTQKPGAPFPHLTTLRVTGFDIEPYFGPSDRITTDEDDLSIEEEPFAYKFAKFVIQYGAPTSPQSATGDNSSEGRDPVPFLEHRITSGGQLLSMATESIWIWRVGTAPPDVDTPVPRMIATTQHDVSWPRVPEPNWPNLENFKGHVNEEPFTLRGYEYPAQTLLYLSYDMQQTVMTSGSIAYNLTLHFEGKLVKNEVTDDIYDEYGGHNHFWDKNTGRWDKLVLFNNLEKHPYPKANFNNLFIAAEA